MTRNCPVNVVLELGYTIKKLNYYPVHHALGIQAWNLPKKHKAKRIVRETLLWIWGQCLMAHDPKNAEPTYQYAQIHQDTKHLKRRFLTLDDRLLYERYTNQGKPPDFAGIASFMMVRIGETNDTQSNAEQKIGEYLKKAYDHFEDTIKEADLTTAEERFREQAVVKLGLQKIR